MRKKDINLLFLLNLLLMIYSMTGICSKLAAQSEFMSIKFIVYYAVFLLLLVFYAFGWQQIIKRMPLTIAFANKAVIIIWGMVWGKLFFDEDVSVKQIIGAFIVMIGVMLYTKSDSGTEGEHINDK